MDDIPVFDIFGTLATIQGEMANMQGIRMNIEIRDAALEARIQRQLEATGSSSVEELLLHLLQTQEESDRWLSESRHSNNTKIRRGIEQLDRGEGIPEDQLDAHLAQLKATPE